MGSILQLEVPAAQYSKVCSGNQCGCFSSEGYLATEQDIMLFSCSSCSVQLADKLQPQCYQHGSGTGMMWTEDLI